MKRIAHISDLHFGRADPAVVDGLAADLSEFAPDVCVVTGDLTQRARPDQFERARRFLGELPFPKLVVPGNHDIAPLWQPLRRISAPFRLYKHHIAELLDSVFIDDEVLVVGLCTVRPLRWKEGGIYRRQLAWTEAMVRDHPRHFHVLAAHHPLVRDELHVVDALDRMGVELMLTGHVHRSYSAPLSRQLGRSHSVLVAGASTATSTRLRGQPNGYNRIALDRARVELDLRVWDGQRFVSQSTASYLRSSEGWLTS
ncbi:MAG TPA: metallophosphoesterase [Polyangiaceae bacterium]|jgi:3',5'-cyclic AMP phosphodiesterase CpdA|nr:metallophosphoesterase [Polyangiaceae bacterium]